MTPETCTILYVWRLILISMTIAFELMAVSFASITPAAERTTLAVEWYAVTGVVAALIALILYFAQKWNCK